MTRPAILAFVLLIGAMSTAPASAQDRLVATAESEIAPIVNNVRLSGTVVSPRTAQISTDLGGLVETVQVDLGARVEKGDALVQLDTALQRLELEQAEAATREAMEEQADAQRRVDIATQLAEGNNLPQNQLDAREAALRIAKAKVERLKADEARWRERIRRHTITAPFAGVVTNRAAEAGEWINPGDMVVELVETDRLRVDVPVPQRYFPQLAKAPRVTLRFDAVPEREVEADVIARVPLSDPTARTFTLRLRPKADDIPLTPGMSARATLQLATGERGVVISRDALIRYPDGRTTVWVTEGEGDSATVSERQVELGRAFDGRIHIRSGLEAGTPVVVRGNEALQSGQQVRITEQTS